MHRHGRITRDVLIGVMQRMEPGHDQTAQHKDGQQNCCRYVA